MECLSRVMKSRLSSSFGGEPMASEESAPIPSPTGPLEGSGTPPKVRPPKGALIVGADSPGLELDEAKHVPEQRDTVEVERPRDKFGLWLANKLSSDDVDVVAIAPKGDDESVEAETGAPPESTTPPNHG